MVAWVEANGCRRVFECREVDYLDSVAAGDFADVFMNRKRIADLDAYAEFLEDFAPQALDDVFTEFDMAPRQFLRYSHISGRRGSPLPHPRLSSRHLLPGPNALAAQTT